MAKIIQSSVYDNQILSLWLFQKTVPKFNTICVCVCVCVYQVLVAKPFPVLSPTFNS